MGLGTTGRLGTGKRAFGAGSDVRSECEKEVGVETPRACCAPLRPVGFLQAYL